MLTIKSPKITTTKETTIQIRVKTEYNLCILFKYSSLLIFNPFIIAGNKEPAIIPGTT